ncbi:sarcosine oxidase subunit alpha [Pseudomonas sp. MDMC216]|jgi:sarcosine oxidase, subunit alpha|nr:MULTISPECIES: sarcosine oxidase subunit alpha [Pseudomonas]MDH1561267.1 sarcosine oxidase subunit alpha [Pseudomonas chengduensis]MDI5994647.1 sarcosine oxidase subunit alpha [Pseudomonas sp. MDMC216]MDI6008332.1 sarcosine oxidase subunit alpha [Pseudomonas sp. MDMC17]MDP3366866.1 sarcosine oxidase subunit alpha [Pseudomonas sp.]MDZ4192518.1 sarcosine oxidase subunit alpha [Pseudomonas sp.]
MSQVNRLAKGGRIDRSQALSFTFNGQTYQGYAGDSLAAALLANGVDIVGRSFKYSRPRGIVAAGAEEPNAVLQIGSTEAAQIPNVRATQQALYSGLVANSTNGWPSVNTDLMGILGKVGGGMMPPGFYYKTFMYPQNLWMTYEKYIRKAAGLGRSPTEVDPDIYDQLNQHCDVLVVGAGPAGLAAALAAGRSGARVILADEQEEFGGSLLDTRETLDGKPAADWVAQAIAELKTLPEVTLLSRATVNGYHDHNFLTIHQRLTDHLGEVAPMGQARQRMHRVRAKRVVLASGAHERPLVYANNDVPGNMLAGAVSTYVRRYGVAPGQELVLSTNNDYAYRVVLDWLDAGRKVVAVADARSNPRGSWVEEARARGVRILTGSAVVEARGSKRVTGARICAIDAKAHKVISPGEVVDCDLIVSSGGYSPVVHLASHLGGRPEWREDILGFVPGPGNGIQQRIDAGAVNGVFALGDVLANGFEAGAKAAAEAGYKAVSGSLPQAEARQEEPMLALFQVPHDKSTARAPKQFVDLQNDVTAAGIELATREGFESVEHVKRYTALGFGTDQGKLGNINGLAIAARSMGISIVQMGTTMFRPNYTPVTFGAVAGRHCGELFDAKRYTAMQAWHLKNGAEFEDVGQWKRPWYFPKKGEDLHAAVARECLAVRNSVGILDASTLGKIDIQGPDAREFLNRVYTNAWTKLDVGKARYGLMCKEDGMVFDDGVTACLADNHFVMTTTTGGAARVMEWLEIYHQTEWPELKVYFTSVTDHWATMTLSGPNSRKLLAKVTDIDLDKDAFPFMSWKEGLVGGVPARVFRISFTGELSYEVNVQADYALGVWEQIIEAGKEFDLTPYGTETMHVLRAEKGFIIVGQDTDASVTPDDLNMGWCVGRTKPFSWIGKRGMNRDDCLREDRKQLVGLKPVDPNKVLPEGAQLVFDPKQTIPMQMVGHVTSSYMSAAMGYSFAMAVVKGGLKRMGERVFAPLADGSLIEAEICSSVFYDPKGDRQNV